MIQSLIASALLSFSIGAKSLPVTVPVTHDFLYESSSLYTDNASIYGAYNLRDDFAYSLEDFDNGRYTFLAEDYSEQKHYINPVYISSYNDMHYYYLSEMIFDIDNSDDSFIMILKCYDVFADKTFTYDFSDAIDIGDVLYTLRDIIINFRTNYYLNGDIAKLFNIFFTHEDNTYTTTYSGYYNFVNNLQSINSGFYVCGSIMFNTNLYSSFANAGDGQTGGSSSQLVFVSYDMFDLDFQLNVYGLPFNKDEVSPSNLLLTDCKMSTHSYSVLSSVGAFSYVRDSSHDNDDFKDLIFSVMDGPVYMIYRLLNFELFGINLFIAMASLLTVVIVVFIIKKLV